MKSMRAFDQVLTDLGIEDIGDRLIGSPERKVISGGQRKRVNIAMELLSDPSVLFLDEPTSGLSSYDAFRWSSLLRRLADGGKTIICTIHQPSIDIFKEFDALMMVARDKGDQRGNARAISDRRIRTRSSSSTPRPQRGAGIARGR